MRHTLLALYKHHPHIVQWHDAAATFDKTEGVPMAGDLLDEVFQTGSGFLGSLGGRSDLPLEVQVQLQGTVQWPPGCTTIGQGVNKGSTRGQQRVNKGSTKGQQGVNKGSIRGQQGVNQGSTRSQQGVYGRQTVMGQELVTR